jgi:hypothetical protein
MSSTLAIGRRLVELVNQGEHLKAIDELYGRDIVSIEAVAMEPMPQRMTGFDAVRGKSVWWLDNHTIHHSKATGPFPHGDRFIVLFDIDCTAKVGPMAGQRMAMQECGLYTVKNGKITQEEFFYAWE